ncbi:uncharacterized protein LOC123652122 [Pipistrellus kuhlii]|uniref:uncharacterized protein LOC123652122 n=1 Tax=Pipistrellus kuhlii TaxID=59472 RepID=UPI001E26EE5E|nr:uncharacterized protein LOC123652122 [Pipistrellus kuhlii]
MWSLCQARVPPRMRARCSPHSLQAPGEKVLCSSECPHTGDGTRSGQHRTSVPAPGGASGSPAPPPPDPPLSLPPLPARVIVVEVVWESHVLLAGSQQWRIAIFPAFLGSSDSAAADDLRYPSLSLSPPLPPSLSLSLSPLSSSLSSPLLPLSRALSLPPSLLCLSLNNEQPEGRERKQDRKREGRQSSPATQNAGAPGGARSLSNNHRQHAGEEEKRKKGRKEEREEEAMGWGHTREEFFIQELEKSRRRKAGGDAEGCGCCPPSPLPPAEPQKGGKVVAKLRLGHCLCHLEQHGASRPVSEMQEEEVAAAEKEVVVVVVVVVEVVVVEEEEEEEEEEGKREMRGIKTCGEGGARSAAAGRAETCALASRRRPAAPRVEGTPPGRPGGPYPVAREVPTVSPAPGAEPGAQSVPHTHPSRGRSLQRTGMGS